MDPLQAKETKQNSKDENIPIVTTHDGGKVVIQLEGSHTTSTATETVLMADKKNVKFKNEKEQTRDDQSKEEIFQEPETNLSEINLEEGICSAADYCKSQLTARFEPLYSITGFSSLTVIDEKQEDMELKNLKRVVKEEETAYQTRTISTTTSSCVFKSIACQTQLPDQISLNELSLMEISSLTSRFEQPNSLNNYAQAENACVACYGSKQEMIKQPLVDTFVQQTLTTPVVIEEAANSPFNVITIEANSTASSLDLRRPPFCHRVWDLFCNFCAATFLCLQVNRDCIFCLGFFAAFVVSASFLTAFFYHTLVVSPVLWQTVENSPF